MITPAISRQHIDGATKKKDQAEWTNDGESAVSTHSVKLLLPHSPPLVQVRQLW
jgi:hypothetical protein